MCVKSNEIGGKGIWITWETQRRNRGISSAFGWRLFELDIAGVRWLRYLRLVPATWRIVRRERPQILAVQNPSIVLAFLAVLLTRCYGMKLLVDAHSGGIYPLEGRSRALLLLSRIIQRSADATIVTNANLKRVVEGNRGHAFVLPDRLPEPGVGGKVPLAGRKNVACIGSFAEDEPYEEIIESARSLEKDIFIYMTGRYPSKLKNAALPSNVRLLGFLPESAFWAHLHSADIIMDLTLREDCLVCGAYEGISLQKPLILSDTEASRAYFSEGCVYVLPDRRSIAEGIRTAIEQERALAAGISRLRRQLEERWWTPFAELHRTVSGWL